MIGSIEAQTSASLNISIYEFVHVTPECKKIVHKLYINVKQNCITPLKKNCSDNVYQIKKQSFVTIKGLTARRYNLSLYTSNNMALKYIKQKLTKL